MASTLFFTTFKRVTPYLAAAITTTRCSHTVDATLSAASCVAPAQPTPDHAAAPLPSRAAAQCPRHAPPDKDDVKALDFFLRARSHSDSHMPPRHRVLLPMAQAPYKRNEPSQPAITSVGLRQPRLPPCVASTAVHCPDFLSPDEERM